MRPQRAVLRDLERTKQRYLQEELEIYFDDISDAAERIWDTLENYKEVVEALEDTNESVLSHRLNDSFRILTAASVVLLPLTLIASIFGMNVAFPGEGQPVTFFLILALMAVLLVALVILFRRRGWPRAYAGAPMTPDDRIERGRAAFARKAWSEAFDLLTEADLETPLGLDDLETAGFAAQYTGRDEAAAKLATRIHHAALKTGDFARAARMAFWIGMAFLQRGDVTQGGGWLGRCAPSRRAWPRHRHVGLSVHPRRDPQGRERPRWGACRVRARGGLRGAIRRRRSRRHGAPRPRTLPDRAR